MHKCIADDHHHLNLMDPKYNVQASKAYNKNPGYGTIGAVIVLVIGFVVMLDKRPDLNIWHKAELDTEFTVDSQVQDFADYLAIEKKFLGSLLSNA